MDGCLAYFNQPLFSFKQDLTSFEENVRDGSAKFTGELRVVATALLCSCYGALGGC